MLGQLILIALREMRRFCDWLIGWLDKHNGAVTAVATFFIAGLTIFLVLTSFEQRRTMQQQLEISQTPYVSPGTKDGVMGGFLLPTSVRPANKTGVLLYFHNGGQGPALNFNVQLFNFEGSTPETHMARLGNDVGQVVQVGGGIAIPAGSDRRAVFDDWISMDDVGAAEQGKKQVSLSGIFEYCDQFGGYTCESFFGRYEPSPIGGFSLVITGSCRYTYPDINPMLPQKLKYLLPCEQPDERQKKGADERQRMIQYMPTPVPAFTPTPK